MLNHERYEQECVDGGGTPAECAYPEPKLSDFVFVQSFEDVARGAVQISIYLVAMTALMIGGSFIGAEFSSGSIANWLSFIPRRGQVYASKLITVAAFSALVSAVATALTTVLRGRPGPLAGRARRRSRAVDRPLAPAVC